MSAAYIISAALRLTGAFECVRAESSFTEIVSRHEALRTRFMAGDEPAQVIERPREFDLSVIDLSHLAIDMRQAEARRLASVEAKRRSRCLPARCFAHHLFRLDDHMSIYSPSPCITWSPTIRRDVFCPASCPRSIALYRWQTLAVAGVADPVCRLRDLAAGLVRRAGIAATARRPGNASWVVCFRCLNSS